MACSARPQSCNGSGLTLVTLLFENCGLEKFVQPPAVQSKPEMTFEDGDCNPLRCQSPFSDSVTLALVKKPSHLLNLLMQPLDDGLILCAAHKGHQDWVRSCKNGSERDTYLEEACMGVVLGLRCLASGLLCSSISYPSLTTFLSYLPTPASCMPNPMPPNFYSAMVFFSLWEHGSPPFALTYQLCLARGRPQASWPPRWPLEASFSVSPVS